MEFRMKRLKRGTVKTSVTNGFENYKQIKIDFTKFFFVVYPYYIQFPIPQNYSGKVVRVVLFLDEYSVSLALGHPVYGVHTVGNYYRFQKIRLEFQSFSENTIYLFGYIFRKQILNRTLCLNFEKRLYISICAYLEIRYGISSYHDMVFAEISLPKVHMQLMRKIR